MDRCSSIASRVFPVVCSGHPVLAVSPSSGRCGGAGERGGIAVWPVWVVFLELAEKKCLDTYEETLRSTSSNLALPVRILRHIEGIMQMVVKLDGRRWWRGPSLLVFFTLLTFTRANSKLKRAPLLPHVERGLNRGEGR